MNKKLLKEYNDFLKSPDKMVTAKPRQSKIITEDGDIKEEEDLYMWDCTLIGPKDTPYADAKFNIQLQIPKEYPFKPPIMQFKTPIFHPNINQNGVVCLDILKQAWSPSFSIEKILMATLSLLDRPNPDDAFNQVAGGLFLTDYPEFERRARETSAPYRD